MPDPLRWRQPRTVLVAGGPDLADPDTVSDDELAGVWAVMALTGRHCFVVLADAPARLAGRLCDPGVLMRVAGQATGIVGRMPLHLGGWRLDMGGARLAGDSGLGGGWQAITSRSLEDGLPDTTWVPPWPLGHVTVWAPTRVGSRP
jgi:hypothetical protein